MRNRIYLTEAEPSAAAPAGFPMTTERPRRRTEARFAAFVDLDLHAAMAKPVVGAPVADTTALAAIAAVNRSDGMLVAVLSDHSVWMFDAASSGAPEKP